jgi:DNA polymerase iota
MSIQCPEGEGEEETKVATTDGKKWLAHPKTLRLTTRPRQALLPDGTRPRSFKRISHSAPLPNFVFGLSESVDSLADKLVKESLIGMFRKLHPEKAGWNLSLVNLAVTNMAETAGNSKTANGRDIGNMFKRQEDVLKDFRVTDVDEVAEDDLWDAGTVWTEREKEDKDEAGTHDDWDNEEEDEDGEVCEDCGMRLPSFAMGAHRRFHVAS